MRIRSVKPEFWSSEDVARLSREDRLLFLGLWSYVDDNGVGRDDYRLIVADLFPLDDPAETRDYVRDGLATLSRALLIARYEVDGRAYLAITGWRHQRIDKPAKPRYPQPPEDWSPPPTSTNGFSRETVARPSRDRRETVAPGTGEQGNRGTGDAPPAPRAAAHASAGAHERAADVDALVGEWITSRRKRPPRNVIQDTERWVKALLRDDIDPDDIRAGMRLWADKGLSPAVLPSVVNEVMNATPAAARAAPRRRTTDDKRAAIPGLVAEVLGTAALQPDNVRALPERQAR